MARNQEDRPQAVPLSKRLRMLADMVTPGNRVADVGCDHAFLSIYLVQAGICPRALAMDVRTGPLAAAREHVAEWGLGSYIDLRLSDGLAACGPGEAETAVCAGMGGRLMERILTQGMDRAREMRELILQPQSELPRFRAFLRETGFAVVEEDAVFEDGKYYFAMKTVYRGGCADCRERTVPHEPVGAEMGGSDGRLGAAMCGPDGQEARDSVGGLHRERWGQWPDEDLREPMGRRPDEDLREHPGKMSDEVPRQRLYDLYGKGLLVQRHPVLLQYLLQRADYVRKLEASLVAAGSHKAAGRLTEVRRELAEIEEALRLYREDAEAGF